MDNSFLWDFQGVVAALRLSPKCVGLSFLKIVKPSLNLLHMCYMPWRRLLVQRHAFCRVLFDGLSSVDAHPFREEPAVVMRGPSAAVSAESEEGFVGLRYIPLRIMGKPSKRCFVESNVEGFPALYPSSCYELG